MARRRKDIYTGSGSVYARMEGAYVPERRGVDLRTAASIAALILRDLKRGWTYDHYGNVVNMNWDLARRRLYYLVPLCVKHAKLGGFAHECSDIYELARTAVLRGRLPAKYARMVRLSGPKARAIMKSLAGAGIIPRRRRRRKVRVRAH